MKVFMSWSGTRSKLTAELLYDWVKCVIQAAQPWISSKGIERGALWFSEINNELKDTTVGIICLTQENKNAPWILFESGALAKGLSTNRVCTLLVDLSPADLQPPLAQFNHTFPTKESMWSLITTLNNGLESNRLDLPILQRVFQTYWPQFESDFAEILENNPQTTVVQPRAEKDILAEILDTTRSMSQRIRSLEDQNGTPGYPTVGGSLVTSTGRILRVPGGIGGVAGSGGGGGGVGIGVVGGIAGGGGGGMTHAQNSQVEAQIADGINHAIQLIKSGKQPHAVQVALVNELGLGKKTAKQVVESALLALGVAIDENTWK